MKPGAHCLFTLQGRKPPSFSEPHLLLPWTMKRFVRRLSSASIEQPPRNYSTGSLLSKGEGSRRKKISLGSKPFHSRSSSEIFNPYLDSSPGYRDVHEHIVYYLGYSYIEEPKSSKEIQAVAKTVRHTMTAHKAVRMQFEDGMLTIHEHNGEKFLVSPLRSIAHSTHDIMKGSNDCIAVTFRSGRYAKQCHVFQAHSSREVSYITLGGEEGGREGGREGRNN